MKLNTIRKRVDYFWEGEVVTEIFDFRPFSTLTFLSLYHLYINSIQVSQMMNTE